MTKVAIAVFASGTGSNARRLYELAAKGTLAPAHVALLVSDQPESKAVAFAKGVGLPVFAMRHKDAGGKDAWEKAVVAKLAEYDISLIVLAGYMRLVGPVLLRAYGGRMINLHPSLLPEFKGLDAISQALKAGVAKTGVTVHYVTEGLDDGPIIAQKHVAILPDDTKDTLSERIHAAEHELLPTVVRTLCLDIKEKNNGKGSN